MNSLLHESNPPSSPNDQISVHQQPRMRLWSAITPTSDDRGTLWTFDPRQYTCPSLYLGYCSPGTVARALKSIYIYIARKKVVQTARSSQATAQGPKSHFPTEEMADNIGIWLNVAQNCSTKDSSQLDTGMLKLCEHFAQVLSIITWSCPWPSLNFSQHYLVLHLAITLLIHLGRQSPCERAKQAILRFSNRRGSTPLFPSFGPPIHTKATCSRCKRYHLVGISELRILQVGQIVHQISVTCLDLNIGTIDSGLAITLLVTPDEKGAQAERKGDLSSCAGQDQFAACLVDRGFLC